MAYQALYRKWRPQTFDDVIGQNHIVSTLKNEILSGKTAHAYLFCGTRGTGKTSCAKIFARAINCENPQNANPCNECSICRGVSEGSVLDIVEIDAASNNGVDNIREIRDEVSYSAAQAKYKIYIIDEVHMLSAGAFNALLKTLEEPPPYVVFILATTEAHKLPPTITSRCQRFDFKRISVHDITIRLRQIVTAENVDADVEALELIARLADGGMRDALSMLDQCISASDEKITRESVERVLGIASDTLLDDCVTAFANKDTAAALEILAQTVANGKDLTNFADRIIQRLRDILVYGICKEPDKLFDCGADILAVIEKQKKLFTPAWIAYCIDTLTAAAGDAKVAKSVRVVYELAFIRICDANFDASTAGLLARIEALEAQLAGGAPVQAAPVARPQPTPVPQPTPAPTPVVEEPVPMPTEAPPTEAELPPWEPSAPIPEPTPAPAPTPVPQPAQPTPPSVPKATGQSAWGDILNVLKKLSPPLYGALSGKKAKISGDSIYMLNEFYIKTILESLAEDLKKATLQICGMPLRVKYVSESEFDAVVEEVTTMQAAAPEAPAQAEEEEDPLDALMQFGGDDISFEN
ncbi:MAG: DNA polymerase III subunit gamma/tau [Clostridia bacterium]|nr:DNA polymerase III subunit gamma/tau [Clostridia bacterium]